MHSVLRHVFDDEFIEAYRHGIVVLCPDGVNRRVFPRLFTYSADYPEKYALHSPWRDKGTEFIVFRVLLATIRNLGGCPCPRCELPKDQIPQVGTIPDDNRRVRLKRTNGTQFSRNIQNAREAIYQYGKTIKSKVVEDILFPLSYVPTSVNSISCLPYR